MEKISNASLNVIIFFATIYSCVAQQRSIAQVLNRYATFIAKKQAENLYRTLQTNNNSYIDFSTNDYLGLAHHPEVVHAGYLAAKKYGAGATGSRLLSGNKDIFEDFENQIAKDKKTEAALIFNSGFQANSSSLSALVDQNSLVIFDKLNHASLYQGVFLAKAKLARYNHLDCEHLEEILKQNKQSNEHQHVFIVSETIFGMDGDCADVEKLIFLAEKYDAFLFLDEAHATGLFGKNGYGISDGLKFNKKRTIVMGTLSKAIGVCGAYVACCSVIKNFLIQKSNGFVYSTALSPFCIGAAFASWKIVANMSLERKTILQNSKLLAKQIKTLGFSTAGENSFAQTNIISILFREIDAMQEMQKKLYQNHIIVSGIRPPTSPTPRIRIALNATHSKNDLEKLLEHLR